MSKKRYELLNEGDVIQEGDEYALRFVRGNHWVPVRYWEVGLNVVSCNPDKFLYRRTLTIPSSPSPVPDAEPVATKPTPPEGYRLLGPEEVIEEGDKIWSDDGTLNPTGMAGSKAGWSLIMRYLRKIAEVPAQSPTIPAGYRFLEVGEQIQTGDWVIDGSPDRKNWGPSTLTTEDNLNAPVSLPYSFARKVVQEVTSEAHPSPGEGYRWVAVGETLAAGDQFHGNVDKFNPKGTWTYTVRWGITVSPIEAGYYRRKVSQPIPDRAVNPCPLRWVPYGFAGRTLEWFNGSEWVNVPTTGGVL